MKRKWLSALLSGALAAALTAAPVSAASVFTGETVDEWAVERVESAIRLELMPECRELAERYDRTLLRTQEDTSTFMADLISMLRDALAPT